MIVLEHLSRTFGPTRAVDDLSLDVHAGELFGFLGPNGAGKTTTIRMLCGLLRPTSGTLAIDGLRYDTGGTRIRAMTGLVPDTPPLYDFLSARQYVRFVGSLYGIAPAESVRDGDALLERLGLADRADDLCKGYSFGMRKKTHLAAVLAARPKVLFLDEPTAGLDPASARLFKDLITELRDEGTTVFVSTHLLETAEEVCDRVAILADGRLRAIGTMDELRTSGRTSLEDIFLALTGSDDVAGDPR